MNTTLFYEVEKTSVGKLVTNQASSSRNLSRTTLSVIKHGARNKHMKYTNMYIHTHTRTIPSTHHKTHTQYIHALTKISTMRHPHIYPRTYTCTRAHTLSHTTPTYVRTPAHTDNTALQRACAHTSTHFAHAHNHVDKQRHTTTTRTHTCTHTHTHTHDTRKSAHIRIHTHMHTHALSN